VPARAHSILIAHVAPPAPKTVMFLQLMDRWDFNDSVKKELLFDTKIIDPVK
jgi:hypothetical protein